MTAVGDRLEIAAEKLVAGGDALARIEGMPVFIPSLYPGDRAVIEIIEVKKGFARGSVMELIEAGPERRAEPCPIASECGGCDWTSLRLDRQLHWKREIVRETLRRVGKVDTDSMPHVKIHPSPLNYRLRSRLQVDPARSAVGFFAPRTYDVVDLTPSCEVVGPLSISELDSIKRVALEQSAESVLLWEDEAGLVVEPVRKYAPPPRGNERTLVVDRYRYRVSTTAFFQVNRHLLSSLIERVRDMAYETKDHRAALDLYAGAGFFTLPMADVFEHVTSVESSPESSALATTNVHHRKHVRVVNERTEEFLRGAGDNSVAFTMLDPPRAGAAEGVMEQIDRLTTERVVYLSCDAVTFARDASRLLRRGWTLASVEIFDLFPNTHHIETLSSFIRVG